jgi:bacteriorhodopsin
MSTFLNLNSGDFIKGLIMAVLTSVITVVYQTVEAGSLTFDWKAIGTMALTSALAYIMKNLFTNSTGKLFGKEQN